MMADSDNEIGYKKPPKSGQFKPGESGNSRGRPKGSSSLETLVNKQLRKKMKITIDGQKLIVSRKEAIAIKIVQTALSGSPDHSLKVTKFLKSFETSEEGPEINHDLSELSREELNFLEMIILKTSGEKG